MHRAAQRAAERQQQQMFEFMQQSQTTMQNFMQVMVANMQQQQEPPVVNVEPPVVHVDAQAGDAHGRIRCEKNKLVLEKVKFIPDDPMNPQIYADFMTNLRTQVAAAASTLLLLTSCSFVWGTPFTGLRMLLRSRFL